MIQEVFILLRYYGNTTLLLQFAATVDGIQARYPCATGAPLATEEAVQYAWWRLVIARGGRREYSGQDSTLGVRLRGLCCPA